jgi:hypothetical protein
MPVLDFEQVQFIFIFHKFQTCSGTNCIPLPIAPGGLNQGDVVDGART